MKKIGIFYGSSTGMTAEVAQEIAKKLGVADGDVHDVAKSSPSDVAPYDVLILGSSTWGAGELQDDWYDFLDGLEVLELKGKKIALFGCGDESMSDTFCGALGELYNRLQKTGAGFVGYFNAEGYDFDESPAFIDGVYVGLLLDNVNKEELTENRLNEWVAKVKSEI
ncbi:flavodoxin [Barnesiella sp. WM24]|uniref:flavodoxin n=1 Tax=Barnesiella sp. WM24 TaxID=2558278 RepID=UPI000B25CE58|nr:flavodoxin [Barnesiella sp. WM24]MDE6114206.1 flavodoxin [Muribaculum sp.]TFU94321.1 flavodoxin [Barnesiella sp. WM24]